MRTNHNMQLKTRICAKAPARIDLSGGTLDIWPIYLLIPDAMTINLGIDLYAEATLEHIPEAPNPGVTLRSEDQKKEMHLSWNDVLNPKATKDRPPSLDLHIRLLKHFFKNIELPKDAAMSLSTKAQSPAGAGLGGSSTLAVAITGAVATWAEGKVTVDPQQEGERFIEMIRDIETQALGVPAGVQDYYGAMYGGLQSIRWKVEKHDRSWLPPVLCKELEKRLILFYSGRSRNSGINNWVLFKSMIDGQAGVLEKFSALAEATNDLESALKYEDWNKVGAAIMKEWNTRKTLAEGVWTPEMEKAHDIARKEGASAFKVCGAGGGGCFFVFMESGDPGMRDRIIQKVITDNIRCLPFGTTPRGLEVTVTHA